MRGNISNAISNDSVKRGYVSEKISVHWRHYISGASTHTIYSTGATTTFPFAYGGIAVPYNAYFSQFMIASLPYSTRQFPDGSSLTLSVYVDNVLKGSQTSSYGNNIRESVVLDFGESIEINRGETITLRLQVDGGWWYCATTSVITQR